jgi:hypothetical protein
MSAGGALDSSVTLEEVFAVVCGKRVPLAPELAGYLVLEIAENADPGGGDVDPRSVFVGDEGTVALVKPRREPASGDAEASVRAALNRLLEASGSQTPALAAAAKRKSGSGLRALAEEIEAALIPVNRAAGRRALARLAREVKRVTLGVGRNALPSVGESVPSSRRPSSPSRPGMREGSAPGPSPSFSLEEDPTTARGHIPEELLRKATPVEWHEMPTVQVDAQRTPSPSQADVDSLIAQFGVSSGEESQQARELKALAGLEPTPPPPRHALRSGAGEVEAAASAPDAPDANEDAVESLLGMDPPGQRDTAAPGSASAAPPAVRGATPQASDGRRRPQASNTNERQLPTQPSQLRRARTSLPSAPRLRSRKGPTLLLGFALIAIAGGVYGVLQLRPHSTPGRTDEPTAAAPTTRAAPAAAACRGTLVIEDVPAHAEALLRAGQAPIDVEKMPVGTRLEFVATAEGYAPRRVVVPAGATWDPGPDGKPRFETAVQLEKSRVKAGTNDPWPAAEPGSEVGGQGPPGTVHVVATPRGSEIWMLAGIGPEVRIEQLKCDQDLDVLLAGPTTFRKRLHVPAASFVVDDQAAPSAKAPARIARVSAK